MSPSRVIQLIMDQLRYRVNGCTSTTSLRPGQRLPRITQGRRQHVLRRYPIGIDHLTQLSSSRSLDRARQLSSRQLPGPLDPDGIINTRTASGASGGGGLVNEFATRFSGSSDLYQVKPGRKPYASINFVTCHDGFTLRDWSAMTPTHNGSQRRDVNDRADDNRSWNCGAEGDRRPGDHLSPQAAETQPDGGSCLAGRSDDLRRGDRDRSHSRGGQQRLLSGQ